MKEFVYVGDPKDNFSGANVMKVKGVTFRMNTPSGVPDHLEDFFDGHSHFMRPKEFKELQEANQDSVLQSEGEYDGYTVAQLREALDARDIDYDASAKKAKLVKLLVEDDEANAE